MAEEAATVAISASKARATLLPGLGGVARIQHRARGACCYDLGVMAPRLALLVGVEVQGLLPFAEGRRGRCREQSRGRSAARRSRRCFWWRGAGLSTPGQHGRGEAGQG